MIPILFGAGETAFTTEGHGRLADGLSCLVTWERNEVYELELVYPPGGVLAEELGMGRQILAVPFYGADPEIFDIYRTDMDAMGQLTVSAWHKSYRLNGQVCGPYTAGNAQAAMTGIYAPSGAEALTFTFSWDGDTVPTGTLEVTRPLPVRSLLGGTEGSILDVYGGTLWWEGNTVTLMQDPGEDRGVRVTWGKNLQELSHQTDIENTYTRVLCYYYKEDTGATWGSAAVTGTEGWTAPRRRTLVLDVTADMDRDAKERGVDPTVTPQSLTEWAEDYVDAHLHELRDVQVATELRFLDLSVTGEIPGGGGLEQLRPMDVVTLTHPRLTEPVKTRAVRTVWDVYRERYDEITIGTLQKRLDSYLTR